MFKFGFSVERCQVQCQLCLGRIKLQRNKRTMLMKQQRKGIADLLQSGKQEAARIRVESVIRENLMMQAFEILELYMELLSVRMQLIAKTKEIPRDMIEAISSIIYAAQRISDIPELSALRTMFVGKYGKEYAAEATSDVTCAKWQVNHNLIRCLLVEPPQPEEKLATLSEIAQEHGVEWDLSAAARDIMPASMMATPLMPGAPGGPPNGGGGGGGAAQPGAGGGGGPAYQQQQHPAQPQPQFTDAQQAAAYANHAAGQARMAADYAVQFAMAQQGGGGGSGTSAAAAQAAPAPPNGWLAQGLDYSGGAPPPGAQHMHSGSVEGGMAEQWSQPQPGGDSSDAAGTSAGGPHVKTYDEIQRAYDAALGPPVKVHLDAAQRAPQQQQQQQQPVHIASPPTAPPAYGMPQPPQHQQEPDAPATMDEYEELNRRLEALKRS